MCGLTKCKALNKSEYMGYYIEDTFVANIRKFNLNKGIC